ncbi:Zn-dependent hydrolase [Bradyrhizobium diazoefficiens]|nr:Zn-dependent hydrolase [Bradyrhizobium diazoefficiens]QQN66710.1 Zn-dependent hydrolase [Bradyrhizobium diazoefficiens]
MSDSPKINVERLWKLLMDTASIGGNRKGGINRLALTDDDRRIRDWFTERCNELGCILTIDQVGNMFALGAGADPLAEPIAIGSHLDTQPTGGKFDGILGVLAGLEVLRTLKEAGRSTRHPLMLVNWTNEEGARFAPPMLGSGVHAGIFDRQFADARTSADGTRFVDALAAIGYCGTAKPGTIRFAAMFELHIEQGPVLEARQKTIGVVRGVQGMRWYDATVVGQEAHSGSTPMDYRKDALVQASHLVLKVRDLAARYPQSVATVGSLSVMPNSRNVIPGSVRLSIDLRHASDAQLDAMEGELTGIVSEMSADGKANLVPVWKNPAIDFDAKCVEAVRRGAETAGYSMLDIYSGAGHDAANVARVAPTAMIFVPCLNGLSHNEAESATKEDCAAGAQTLLNAVIEYDAMLA